ACRDIEISYAQLNERAVRFAAALQRLGVRAGDRVVLACERNEFLLVGMLGVVCAGAAFVPVDASQPAARNAAIFADANPALVLVQRSLHPSIPETQFQVVCAEDLAGEEQSAFVFPTVHPESAAYIIYTSGTTGKPKGVMVHHRALLGYADAVAARL